MVGSVREGSACQPYVVADRRQASMSGMLVLVGVQFVKSYARVATVAGGENRTRHAAQERSEYGDNMR